tara:strand:+ start:348 stop:578 length:231 start_codon:yes stop_codon:yes gene_type:complete
LAIGKKSLFFLGWVVQIYKRGRTSFFIQKSEKRGKKYYKKYQNQNYQLKLLTTVKILFKENVTMPLHPFVRLVLSF